MERQVTLRKIACGGLSALLAALMVFTGTAALSATDSPVFKQAIQDYNSRKYKAALAKLESLPRNGPGSDLIRYYLALCYQASNQINSATNEYAAVYRSSQNKALRHNSALALRSLNKWSQHRKYEGNGNNFSRQPASSMRRSGGRGGG